MQYKTITNPSFLVLMLDVQDHLKAGWEIDPNNLPSNNFVYYEVNLVKDDAREKVKEAFKELSETVPKKVGRPKQEARV